MVTVCSLTPAHVGMAQAMLQEYIGWARTLETASGSAPTFQNFDEEVETLPGVFAPPKGAFLVAEVDGIVCGCVAMKPVDETTCELKRLYVRAAARRQGAGRALVQRLIHDAKAAGYQRIVLDTHISMKGAHVVYRSLGFKDAPIPSDFPDVLKDRVLFMEKDLASQ